MRRRLVQYDEDDYNQPQQQQEINDDDSNSSSAAVLNAMGNMGLFVFMDREEEPLLNNEVSTNEEEVVDDNSKKYHFDYTYFPSIKKIILETFMKIIFVLILVVLVVVVVSPSIIMISTKGLIKEEETKHWKIDFNSTYLKEIITSTSKEKNDTRISVAYLGGEIDDFISMVSSFEKDTMMFKFTFVGRVITSFDLKESDDLRSLVSSMHNSKKSVNDFMASVSLNKIERSRKTICSKIRKKFMMVGESLGYNRNDISIVEDTSMCQGSAWKDQDPYDLAAWMTRYVSDDSADASMDLLSTKKEEETYDLIILGYPINYYMEGGSTPISRVLRNLHESVVGSNQCEQKKKVEESSNHVLLLKSWIFSSFFSSNKKNEEKILSRRNQYNYYQEEEEENTEIDYDYHYHNYNKMRGEQEDVEKEIIGKIQFYYISTDSKWKIPPWYILFETEKSENLVLDKKNVSNYRRFYNSMCKIITSKSRRCGEDVSIERFLLKARG